MNYRFFVLLLCAMVTGSCYAVKNDDPLPVKNVIEVAGRQGVACDGDYYYVSGSTALYKYSMKGNLVLSNETPFASITSGSPAPNHIGDIDVYEGEIYVGCEYFMDGVAQNIQIAIYDVHGLESRFRPGGMLWHCGRPYPRDCIFGGLGSWQSSVLLQ